MVKMAEPLLSTYTTPPFCEQKKRRGRKRREKERRREEQAQERKTVQGR